ncbi:MAG: sulfatase [Bacteroidota bacterium]
MIFNIPIRTSYFLVLITLLFACSSNRSTERASDQPNIVLIVADDLGWADLGFTGSDLFETPNLDQFAREGVYFSNFYSASPVCSPTRASILTGKYPARLKMTTHYENSGDYWRNADRDMTVYNNPLVQPNTVGNLPQSEITLAEYLRDLGYFTAHIGKWHLGNFEHYPENQGFDVNVGGTSWGAPDTYWYPWTGNNFQKQLRYIPGLVFKAGESTFLPDRLTDKAIEIIQEKRNDPFFLHLNFHIPHTPMEGKKELVEYFKSKVKPGMKDTNPVYAAMIKSLDENFGRVLKALKSAGISDHTIVIFLSDNGGRIGEFQEWETVANNAPLRSGKGSVYEGGIRVPLIVKWPGVTKPGAVSDEPTITNDLYPTIAEMLGGKEVPSNALDGISLVPQLINAETTSEREYLYWHYPHYYSTTTPVTAVRKGKWKLIHYYEDDQLELYNLEEDLGEEKNLVDEHPGLTKELFENLKAWRRDMDAQSPEKNPSNDPTSDK